MNRERNYLNLKATSPAYFILKMEVYPTPSLSFFPFFSLPVAQEVIMFGIHFTFPRVSTYVWAFFFH